MRGMENPIKNDGVVTLFLYPTEREYPPLRKNIIFLFSKKDFFKKKKRCWTSLCIFSSDYVNLQVFYFSRFKKI